MIKDFSSSSSSLTEEESSLLWQYVHKKFRKEKEIGSLDLNNVRKRRIKNYDELSLEKYRKTDYDQTELSFIEDNSRNDGINESSSLLNGYLLAPIFPDIDYALEELRVQFEDF